MKRPILSKLSILASGLLFLSIGIGSIGLAGARSINILRPAEFRGVFPGFPLSPITNGVSVATSTNASNIGQSQVQCVTVDSGVAAHSVLVAGSPGQQIRVLGYHLTSPLQAGTITFESSTSNTELDYITMQYSDSYDSPSMAMPLTASGDSLNTTVTGTGNKVTGTVRYVVQSAN